MAKITILDIKPTGADLFDDSESFMSELSSDELEQAMGGLIASAFPSPRRTPPWYFPTKTNTKIKTTILPHTPAIL